MLALLVNLDATGVLLLFLAVLVCAPVLELLLRRLLQRHLRSSDSIANYVQMLTVFYGLLLGLVAVDLWQKQDAAQFNAVAESNQVRILNGLARYFPGAGTVSLALGDYVQGVVKKEWPRMLSGDTEMLFRASPELDLVRATLLDLKVTTPAEQAVYVQMLASYDAIVQAREQRLLDSARRLPDILWIVLLLGGVFIWLGTWFIPAQYLRSQLLLSSITSGYLFLLVYLIAVLEHPFLGAWRVDPSTYQHVLQTFH